MIRLAHRARDVLGDDLARERAVVDRGTAARAHRGAHAALADLLAQLDGVPDRRADGVGAELRPQ
jgi:hypothetical protein